jgi:hypothetical protein
MKNVGALIVGVIGSVGESERGEVKGRKRLM